MGAKERRIGKRAELEVVDLTDGWYVHRGDGRLLNSRTGRQHRGGPDSPDVAHNMGTAHWEVTRDQGVIPTTRAMTEKLEQAAGDAGRLIPMVFHRRVGNARSWQVTMLMAVTGGTLRAVNPRHVDEDAHEVTMSVPAAFDVMGWSPV